MQGFERERELHITPVLEFIHRQQAAGRTGVTRDEHQFILGRSCFAPLEVMIDFSGSAVLIRSEETNIQDVPWKFEIVGIASKKSGLLLRRKYQPNVGILFRAIKVVLTALIQGHDITAQSGPVE